MGLPSEPPTLMEPCEIKNNGLSEETKNGFPNLEQRTRKLIIERHKSCEVSQATLSEMARDSVPPRRHSQILETIKSGDNPGNVNSPHEESPTGNTGLHRHTVADAAWEALKQSIVYFRGQPIGTIAAMDKSQGTLNYDQVFMRDFVPTALAFLMKGEQSIVKNFLLETARLQSQEKVVDLFQLGQGVMPASFKVHRHNPTKETETLLADFGETAIGRVASVDSGLSWIFLLRAYTK